MAKINEMPPVVEQLIQNAVDYGFAMAATATPEQIEEMRRQNELFGRELEICQNCGQEFGLELENCESCGKNKLPF